jgi:hypothetical protein
VKVSIRLRVLGPKYVVRGPVRGLVTGMGTVASGRSGGGVGGVTVGGGCGGRMLRVRFTLVPQFLQNLSPSDRSAPHLGQINFFSSNNF